MFFSLTVDGYQVDDSDTQLREFRWNGHRAIGTNIQIPDIPWDLQFVPDDPCDFSHPRMQQGFAADQANTFKNGDFAVTGLDMIDEPPDLCDTDV